MSVSGGWSASSLIAAEDRQQLVQPGLHPPEVADVAPMDGVRGVAEMVVDQLAQGLNLVKDHRQALQVGVEGAWLVDDATIHALNDQEAKLSG